MADGIKGFFTSKRGIGLIIGAILMALSAFTPIEIDNDLRVKLIDGIFWLTGVFVAGTSLSDTFGKGKIAEQNRAKLAKLIGTGMEVAAEVAADLKKDKVDDKTE
jgi:hypothetical protein